MFLAQVSKCYPAEMSDYPQKLMDILKRHSTVIDPVNIFICSTITYVTSNVTINHKTSC